MKLSLNWISDFIDLNHITTEELVSRLTLTACEVDGVENKYGFLDRVVVAKITKTTPHPDADRLTMCETDAGSFGKPPVVTGATVTEGMLVALALEGAELPGKDGGESLIIKPAKLRGKESNGMYCSAKELDLEDLGAFGDGLLEIPAGVDGKFPKPGTPLSEIFPVQDTVLDIDNKSITHRPDLWSHFGFAREIAAIYGLKLKYNPLETDFPAPDPEIPGRKIQIDEGAAKAYFGLNCRNVAVKESPLEIKARLLATGQKPKNNIVDASNYLMFELGQPNHTFDAALLTNKTVRVAKNGEDIHLTEFTTLDGESREIPKGAILILDGTEKDAGPLALGGVMGGRGSEVRDETNSLFLESATFYRESIRKTLSVTQLRTDSAVRFEKGQDPLMAKPALARLFQLIQKTCPSMKAGMVTGNAPDPAIRNEIGVSLKYLRDRLGFDISEKEVEKILGNLGFQIDKSGKGNDIQYTFTAPTYRSQYDVTIPDDIVEELGRVYGYDNIEPTPPLVPCSPAPMNRKRNFERDLKERIVASGGFYETRNYSFINLEENRLFHMDGLRVLNPITAGKDRMRVSLIPGLLHQGAGNQDRFDDVRLFEFGRIYKKEKGPLSPDLPVEEQRIAFLRIPPSGGAAQHRDDSRAFQSFLEMRRLIESILFQYGTYQWKTDDRTDSPDDPFQKFEAMHPGCRIAYRSMDGRLLATVGLLHPGWEKRFELKRPAVIAEIIFENLFEQSEVRRRSSEYIPPSVFPDSSFELTVVMDESASTSLPVATVDALNLEELKELRFLTVYRGAPLEDDKKAVSYKMICGRPDRTLSGEEFQKILETVVESLKKDGFPLR